MNGSSCYLQLKIYSPCRYGYAVQDDIGNDFNKQETSDGGTVQGQYSVLLPDGRIQTVTYSVAPNTGFVVSWKKVVICCNLVFMSRLRSLTPNITSKNFSLSIGGNEEVNEGFMLICNIIYSSIHLKIILVLFICVTK